jgi:outer membrane protein TolC
MLFPPAFLSANGFSRPVALACALVLGGLGALVAPVHAQQEGESLPPLPEEGDAGAFLIQEADASGEQVVSLTLPDAVRLALAQNYSLLKMRLNVENAQAQIREAWGQVLPQVSVDGSYTRNVIAANPFAGSDVGGLFGGGNSTDWVAFNERARTDDDPSTAPISFPEFERRQAEGRQAAGIGPGGAGGNPFTVDNQFATGLSVSQPLFNGSAFVAIQGARQLEDVNVLAAGREEQTLVDQTRQAYYGALFAAEQARVAAQSADRTRETYREVARQVAAGTTPKFERVSARVELENLRAQVVQRRSQANIAIDELKRTIGFPVDQPVRLRGALRAENVGQFTQVSMDDAMTRAIQNRPDVKQAQLGVELRQIDKRTLQATYLPTVSAFANFNYTGRVPDSRTRTFMPNRSDPFTFAQETRGFFADSYWNPSVAVGLRLSWNVFDGFQRAAQIEQREVAVNQARLDYERLLAQVRLDVQRALRNLATGRQRLQSQRANVARAELGYEIAQKRLGVGVANQLQLREASDQLDQARLNYLQAVYDYLTAKSAFETAVGEPLTEDSLLQFTQR